MLRPITIDRALAVLPPSLALAGHKRALTERPDRIYAQSTVLLACAIFAWRKWHEKMVAVGNDIVIKRSSNMPRRT